MSVESDIAFLRQKIEEIDRKINQLSSDVRKLSSHFGEKEIDEEKSVINMI
ncbi:MAG TPA: hypothetical protein VI968_02130 [archaeon]|nr:hypothetical protein [archaeon]